MQDYTKLRDKWLVLEQTLKKEDATTSADVGPKGEEPDRRLGERKKKYKKEKSCKEAANTNGRIGNKGLNKTIIEIDDDFEDADAEVDAVDAVDDFEDVPTDIISKIQSQYPDLEITVTVKGDIPPELEASAEGVVDADPEGDLDVGDEIEEDEEIDDIEDEIDDEVAPEEKFLVLTVDQWEQILSDDETGEEGLGDLELDTDNEILGEEYSEDTGERGDKKEWRNKKGQLHRLDGPAVEYSDGTKAWYVNGEYHRLDGPAIERSDGSKEWFVDGHLHRIDGPAIEYPDGYKAWYVNGQKFTEKEFNQKFNVDNETEGPDNDMAYVQEAYKLSKKTKNIKQFKKILKLAESLLK